MTRVSPTLIVAVAIVAAGCSRKSDPVMAAFINDQFSTNRIVFYASGKYEFYGANDDGSLQSRPYVTGAYVGGVSNYVVSIKKEDVPLPESPTRVVYRIVKHDGLVYLFDERGNAARKYEETKDPRELRSAWRREGG